MTFDSTTIEAPAMRTYASPQAFSPVPGSTPQVGCVVVSVATASALKSAGTSGTTHGRSSPTGSDAVVRSAKAGCAAISDTAPPQGGRRPASMRQLRTYRARGPRASRPTGRCSSPHKWCRSTCSSTDGTCRRVSNAVANDRPACVGRGEVTAIVEDRVGARRWCGYPPSSGRPPSRARPLRIPGRSTRGPEGRAPQVGSPAINNRRRRTRQPSSPPRSRRRRRSRRSRGSSRSALPGSRVRSPSTR